MSKILLFGKNGQVGSELTRFLSSFNLIALGRQDVDVLDRGAVSKVFDDTFPQIVINTVAYNDVDGAELHPDLAMQLNVQANEFLARLSAKHNAVYITFSSDFVFDGKKRTPYFESDEPKPINQYGKSKFMGEVAVQESGSKPMIFRTSSVYSLHRPCFLTKIIQQAKEKSEISVRADLINCPTSAQFIARVIASLVQRHGPDLQYFTGLYHLCSSGCTSRYQWAEAIQKKMNLDVRIVPLDDFPQTGAPRPAYTVLSNELFQRTFEMEIPAWDDMLYDLLDGG
ncbi:MAG: dTDP-4-dehydrorhamnose reductase [Anaerolineales bacterium]